MAGAELEIVLEAPWFLLPCGKVPFRTQLLLPRQTSALGVSSAARKVAARPGLTPALCPLPLPSPALHPNQVWFQCQWRHPLRDTSCVSESRESCLLDVLLRIYSIPEWWSLQGVRALGSNFDSTILSYGMTSTYLFKPFTSNLGESPGGPLIRTQGCRGCWFNPRLGHSDLTCCAVWTKSKKKKKKKKKPHLVYL